MPNDFKKSQLSKSERMIAEVAVQQEMMARDLWTISSNVVALGLLLNVDPKKIAEHLVDDSKIKEYAQKINAAIRELEDKKRAESGKNDTANQRDDNHSGHDHSDPNHKH